MRRSPLTLQAVLPKRATFPTRSTLNDQALKKRILPDEFAQMILFLAADDSGGCTAQQFMVDGGRF